VARRCAIFGFICFLPLGYAQQSPGPLSQPVQDHSGDTSAAPAAAPAASNAAAQVQQKPREEPYIIEDGGLSLEPL
jgi:hypothetical protein